jgi:hypothetical protein
VNPASWILIAIVAIILLLFSLVRRKGGAAKYPEIVQGLLYDIRLNQALAQHFLEIARPRRFENVNWLMNKDKIGFLNENVKEMLYEIYKLVDEYNAQIKAARKAKSDSYKSIDLTRFKELLEKTRKELEDWMIEKTGAKDLPPKYPTVISTLFGER